MTKRKVGLILFWVGVGYAFLWAVVVTAFGLVPAWKTLTMDELRQTTWAFYDDDDLIVPELGTGMILWTTGFQPGALVAGVGLLLRSGARGSTMWGFGIGVVLVSIIPMGMVVLDHIPAFLSIGGTLILAFFFGMLWLWAKERTAQKGSSTAAADFRQPVTCPWQLLRITFEAWLLRALSKPLKDSLCPAMRSPALST